MDGDEKSKSKLDDAIVRKLQLETNAHIPGLDLLAHTKTASDANLAPFFEKFPKMIHQDSQVLYSLNTDHAAWAPGLCKNISMYEGRFLPKVTCEKQKDPKRTKVAKARKKNKSIKEKKQVKRTQREKISMQKKRVQEIKFNETKDLHGNMKCLETHDTNRKLCYKSKGSNQNGKLGINASISCSELSDKLRQLISARIRVLEESISKEGIQNIKGKPNIFILVDYNF